VKKLLSLTVLALLAIACAEPFTTEEFIPGGGPFVFTVDLSDSTATYDLYIYTRLDGLPEELLPVEGAQMRAEWRSPSDSLFSQTFYLPLTGNRNSFFSRQVYEPFREGWQPAQPGIWTLTLRQEDRSQVIPLRGLGLSVTKNQ